MRLVPDIVGWRLFACGRRTRSTALMRNALSQSSTTKRGQSERIKSWHSSANLYIKRLKRNTEGLNTEGLNSGRLNIEGLNMTMFCKNFQLVKSNVTNNVALKSRMCNVVIHSTSKFMVLIIHHIHFIAYFDIGQKCK